MRPQEITFTSRKFIQTVNHSTRLCLAELRVYKKEIIIDMLRIK